MIRAIITALDVALTDAVKSRHVEEQTCITKEVLSALSLLFNYCSVVFLYFVAIKCKNDMDIRRKSLCQNMWETMGRHDAI